MRAVAAMFLLTILAVALQVTALSAEDQRLVVHEKRDFDSARLDIGNRRRIDADVVLPMRISLKQNEDALRNAESWLIATADPDSPQFGQHWSQEDVISAFQPAAESVKIVSDWLRSNGILQFTHSENKQWIAFDVSAAHAEKLLQTKYFEHEQKYTNDARVSFEASCEEYKLPQIVSQHVDFIKPGVKSSEITGASARSREFLERLANGVYDNRPSPSPASWIPFPKPLPSTDDLSKCWNYVTPACIRALYNIPLADPTQAISPDNALGLFETEEETYYQGGLDLFFSQYAPYIPTGTSPFYHRVDNATARPPQRFKGPGWKNVGGEEMFDLDISLPIIYPQNASVYVVRTPGYFLSSIDRFADAIDGSYCKKPQPNRNEGVLECGVYKPNNVISLSWGTSEAFLPRPHVNRLCTEFLKLGLQGSSVFFSSGDFGVEAVYKGRSTNRLCQNSTRNGPQVFDPLFPASCPWVTAVGATKILKGQSVESGEVAGTVWNHNYTESGPLSGGGFALDFDRPSYQNAAVSHYFQTANPPWNYFYNGNFLNSSGGFNRGRYNRNGRGYPDVSSNGWPIATVSGRVFELAYGTSASSPTWGSIINRIVEERIRAGKGPLGFINPVLYKNPQAMNDITRGGNGLCKPDEGFECAVGWDPVSGLGTPNYPKLLDTFMALP